MMEQITPDSYHEAAAPILGLPAYVVRSEKLPRSAAPIDLAGGRI
jgi:hypothetical protein